jgi:hypothetical protein
MSPLKFDIRIGKIRKAPKSWMINELMKRLIGLKPFLIKNGLSDQGTLILSCVKKEDPSPSYRPGEILAVGHKTGTLFLKFQASGSDTIFFFHCFSDVSGSTGKRLMDIFDSVLTEERRKLRNAEIPNFFRGELSESNEKKDVVKKEVLASSPKPLLEKLEDRSQILPDNRKENMRGFINNENEVSDFLGKIFGRANSAGLITEGIIREELSKISKKVTNQTVGQIIRRLIERGKLFKDREGYTFIDQGVGRTTSQSNRSQNIPQLIEPEVICKENPVSLSRTSGMLSLLDQASFFKTLNEVYLDGMKEIGQFEQVVITDEKEVLELEATLLQRKTFLEESKKKLTELRAVVSKEGKHFYAHQQFEALVRLVSS